MRVRWGLLWEEVLSVNRGEGEEEEEASVMVEVVDRRGVEIMKGGGA